MRHWPYALIGLLFGFTLMKSEAVSWYRIQEMFHFQSFHMYGIIMTAVITAFIGVQILRRQVGKASLEGAPISIPAKKPGRIRYPLGGLIFGIAWGIVGLCPGPIFALVGAGVPGAFLVLFGALHGTWWYGALQEKLPQ